MLGWKIATRGDRMLLVPLCMEHIPQIVWTTPHCVALSFACSGGEKSRLRMVVTLLQTVRRFGGYASPLWQGAMTSLMSGPSLVLRCRRFTVTSLSSLHTNSSDSEHDGPAVLSLLLLSRPLCCRSLLGLSNMDVVEPAFCLKSYKDFDAWDTRLGAVLIAQGVDHYLDNPPPPPSDEVETRKNEVAWSLVIRSLSINVKNLLSPEARDWETANTCLLYQELRRMYSASTELPNEPQTPRSAINGFRLAAHLKDMFRTSINEDEDPSIGLARIRSAHAQLAMCGETMSQGALVSAMLLALPPSYSTTRSILMTAPDLSADLVSSTARDEWILRQDDRRTRGHSHPRRGRSMFQ